MSKDPSPCRWSLKISVWFAILFREPSHWSSPRSACASGSALTSPQRARVNESTYKSMAKGEGTQNDTNGSQRSRARPHGTTFPAHCQLLLPTTPGSLSLNRRLIDTLATGNRVNREKNDWDRWPRRPIKMRLLQGLVFACFYLILLSYGERGINHL